MGKPTLLLYVDVVSPFAYLAFHVITVSGNENWTASFSYIIKLWIRRLELSPVMLIPLDQSTEQYHHLCSNCASLSFHKSL